MIPAILAAPLVQGVVGSVIGGVANLFSPSAPPSASSATFTPYLNSASSAAAPQPAPDAGTPNGTMRSSEWGQMGKTDLQSWAKSLSGKHVDATDESGRSISGTVNGVQLLGNTLALNIGGHLVSLSQLKQVSWSPSVA